MSWQQYKNAISSKYGPWQPTSTPEVEIINTNGYRYTARTVADGWTPGYTIDYVYSATGKTIGKFRFTN